MKYKFFSRKVLKDINQLCEINDIWDYNSSDDIYKCLDEKTYKVTDFIKEHIIGDFVWDRNQRNTINSSFWKREVSSNF